MTIHNIFRLLLGVSCVVSVYAQTSAQTNQLQDREFDVNGVKFKMVFVDGGTYSMGRLDGFQDDYLNHSQRIGPAHEVTLSNYWIGQTEVTQGLWKAVTGNEPAGYIGDNYPVGKVSWNDCQGFIRRLNALTGANFRLPTEAEWEFAARGGKKSKGYRYSGSNLVYDVAWCSDNANGAPHEVATKQANELGLYDMSGNVWEWCSDRHGLYQGYTQVNPRGSNDGHYRVWRGGSFFRHAWRCLVAERDCCPPDINDFGSDVGFRLALNRDKEFEVYGVKFTMVYVEGGTFTMGATSEQGNDFDTDELPAHQVTVSDFMIGQTEVTQGLWRYVMGSNPSSEQRDDLPVNCISWVECQEFISRLNDLTGQNFRMLTEAEWEYAARGGNKSKGFKYSGGNNLDHVAWYGNNASGRIHTVATKQSNELGIYDMSGNVWEWCSDWYGNYNGNPQTNPIGVKKGTHRIHRGGGWYNEPREWRVSDRGGYDPNGINGNLGFRIALSIK